jgi:hypothetical protein
MLSEAFPSGARLQAEEGLGGYIIPQRRRAQPGVEEQRQNDGAAQERADFCGRAPPGRASGLTQLPASTEDLPWTAYVDALLAWRRFIVGGVLGAWLVVLVVGLTWPRSYECEATLSFPPTVSPKKDEAPKAGIQIPIYKRFSKALADEGVLAKGLKGVMEAPEVHPLLLTLEDHISPVTTSPLGDAQRMSRDDTVIGVKITFSGQPAERTNRVVMALAKLCRDTLIRALAHEQIEMRMAQANEETRTALKERARLGVEVESLIKQADDVSRLSREFTGAEGGAGRQVVETREGGQFYLPPLVQLVGLRARIADDGHEIRVADHIGRLSALRLRFLESLNERLAWEKLAGPDDADTLTVFREELKRFLAEPSVDASDSTTLRLEVENMASTLASASQTTTLVQLPTVRKQARVPLMLGAAAAAVALVLLAALLGESWRRLHTAS